MGETAGVLSEIAEEELEDTEELEEDKQALLLAIAERITEDLVALRTQAQELISGETASSAQPLAAVLNAHAATRLVASAQDWDAPKARRLAIEAHQAVGFGLACEELDRELGRPLEGWLPVLPPLPTELLDEPPGDEPEKQHEHQQLLADFTQATDLATKEHALRESAQAFQGLLRQAALKIADTVGVPAGTSEVGETNSRTRLAVAQHNMRLHATVAPLFTQLVDSMREVNNRLSEQSTNNHRTARRSMSALNFIATEIAARGLDNKESSGDVSSAFEAILPFLSGQPTDRFWGSIPWVANHYAELVKNRNRKVRDHKTSGALDAFVALIESVEEVLDGVGPSLVPNGTNADRSQLTSALDEIRKCQETLAALPPASPRPSRSRSPEIKDRAAESRARKTARLKEIAAAAAVQANDNSGTAMRAVPYMEKESDRANLRVGDIEDKARDLKKLTDDLKAAAATQILGVVRNIADALDGLATLLEASRSAAEGPAMHSKEGMDELVKRLDTAHSQADRAARNLDRSLVELGEASGTASAAATGAPGDRSRHADDGVANAGLTKADVAVLATLAPHWDRATKPFERLIALLEKIAPTATGESILKNLKSMWMDIHKATWRFGVAGDSLDARLEAIVKTLESSLPHLLMNFAQDLQMSLIGGQTTRKTVESWWEAVKVSQELIGEAAAMADAASQLGTERRSASQALLAKAVAELNTVSESLRKMRFGGESEGSESAVSTSDAEGSEDLSAYRSVMDWAGRTDWSVTEWTKSPVQLWPATRTNLDNLFIEAKRDMAELNDLRSDVRVLASGQASAEEYANASTTMGNALQTLVTNAIHRLQDATDPALEDVGKCLRERYADGDLRNAASWARMDSGLAYLQRVCDEILGWTQKNPLVDLDTEKALVEVLRARLERDKLAVQIAPAGLSAELTRLNLERLNSGRRQLEVAIEEGDGGFVVVDNCMPKIAAACHESGLVKVDSRASRGLRRGARWLMPMGRKLVGAGTLRFDGLVEGRHRGILERSFPGYTIVLE